MAKNPVYSTEQKQAFVNRAAEIGLTPAMKELGYPKGKPTASVWCKNLGVKVQLSELQQHAAQMKTFYGAQEKLALCQKVLDECYDILMHGEQDPAETDGYMDPVTGQVSMIYVRRPLSAALLSRISATVQRTIQTMELLEGRVTDRIEQISQDSTDIELAEMIRDYKASNARQEKELLA